MQLTIKNVATNMSSKQNSRLSRQNIKQYVREAKVHLIYGILTVNSIKIPPRQTLGVPLVLRPN